MISFFEKVVIKENEVMGIQSKYYSLTPFGCRDFSESFLCDYKKNPKLCVCRISQSFRPTPSKKEKKNKKTFSLYKFKIETYRKSA